MFIVQKKDFDMREVHAIAAFHDEVQAEAYADAQAKAEREYSPYYFTVVGPIPVDPEFNAGG